MTRENVLFAVGLGLTLGAAALMLWSSVDITPLIVLGVIGVVLVAVAARRRG